MTLEEMRTVDVRTVDPETLVDVTQIDSVKDIVTCHGKAVGYVVI